MSGSKLEIFETGSAMVVLPGHSTGGFRLNIFSNAKTGERTRTNKFANENTRRSPSFIRHDVSIVRTTKKKADSGSTQPETVLFAKKKPLMSLSRKIQILSVSRMQMKLDTHEKRLHYIQREHIIFGDIVMGSLQKMMHNTIPM